MLINKSADPANGAGCYRMKSPSVRLNYACAKVGGWHHAYAIAGGVCIPTSGDYGFLELHSAPLYQPPMLR